MATQAVFLTFWAKPTNPVRFVNQGKSREYRNDENLINLEMSARMGIWPMPGVHEKGILKNL